MENDIVLIMLNSDLVKIVLSFSYYSDSFLESWGSFCMTITMNFFRNVKIITHYWKKTVYICTIMIFYYYFELASA